MKVQFRQVEQFVKSPDRAARVILVYGPDGGLVRERCDALGRSVVADLNDPFNVAALSAEVLADDPARLSDEANAISMMGGERLIKIADGGDKLTVLLKDYLKDPSDSALVVIQAGELGPRSSLRKLCETAKNAAALACYVEDERDVSRFIRELLQAEGIGVEPDAVQWLAANISGDRRKVRSELEKLVIYKGDEQTPVSIVDARNACGAAGADGLDDLVYQVAGRNSAAALKSYTTLMAEGTAFVVVLRSLQNHFRRLHLAKSHMQSGMDAEGAMKKLAPPVFFKQAPMFRAQMNSWPLPVLNQVLGRLSDLEAQCKQTGIPVETLCAQAVLAISKVRG